MVIYKLSSLGTPSCKKSFSSDIVQKWTVTISTNESTLSFIFFWQNDSSYAFIIFLLWSILSRKFSKVWESRTWIRLLYFLGILTHVRFLLIIAKNMKYKKKNCVFFPLNCEKIPIFKKERKGGENSTLICCYLGVQIFLSYFR